MSDADEVMAALREPLAVILAVAAELVREGDRERAMRLKAARDSIQRATCPHDRGTHDVLYMSGTVTLCRICGSRES